MGTARLVPQDDDRLETVPLGDAPVTIGRNADNTLRLDDDRASRYHCVIEPDGQGGLRIRDLGSRNGIKVNDTRVAQAPLRVGDRVRVGSTSFRVAQLDATPAETGDAPPPGEPADGWVAELASLLATLRAGSDAGEDPLELIDGRGKPSPALTQGGEGPRALAMLIRVASAARATDLHVEPRDGRSQVRMRVDGQMVPVVALPVRTGELVYGLIKTACVLRLAAGDAVQDGHFSVRLAGRRIDYRVSFTPSVHGQKLVVRVLDLVHAPRHLGDLGLPPYMLERVRKVCQRDAGLLLVCGPTGSGKTTTLYTAMRDLDRTARNVVTIEDPVEYQLDNVTQIPIDEARGHSFHQLLRSVLRQDPDVILVGEIRDEETARTAMQAALTGHLVFSTLHARDSIAAVFRLLDLKVEPYLVANALNLVLAQRLLRLLCPACRLPVRVAPGQATRIGRFLEGRHEVYTPRGCRECLRTGHKGRRAIFELLDVTDELRDVILREPTIAAMRRVIEAGLFLTLQQSGWQLAARGLVSLDEVERVAGEG